MYYYIFDVLSESAKGSQNMYLKAQQNTKYVSETAKKNST